MLCSESSNRLPSPPREAQSPKDEAQSGCSRPRDRPGASDEGTGAQRHPALSWDSLLVRGGATGKPLWGTSQVTLTASSRVQARVWDLLLRVEHGINDVWLLRPGYKRPTPSLPVLPLLLWTHTGAPPASYSCRRNCYRTPNSQSALWSGPPGKTDLTKACSNAPAVVRKPSWNWPLQLQSSHESAAFLARTPRTDQEQNSSVNSLQVTISENFVF